MNINSDKKIKIAFFMTSILEQGGGMEKYMVETASNLSSFGDVEVDVVTMDDDFTKKILFLLEKYYLIKVNLSDIYREPLDSIIIKLGKASYFKINNFRNLRNKLNKYDIIYSKNEILETCIFKFIIGYKNIPPVILGVHTPHFYPIKNNFQSQIHNFLYNSYFYNFLCSGIKAFHVANSESYNLLFNQFSNKKIYFISNPFNFEKFTSTNPETNFRFHRKKNMLNILWLARLSEQKGVNDLIMLIKVINKSKFYNQVFWHVAGAGELKYEEELNKISNTFTNVRYYGYIKNQNVPTILKNVDLFLSTSKWEVSPYNLLEAQAFNLPVISYDIPGPKDIILNNKTGILCKDFDDMRNSIINFIEKNYKFKDISQTINEKFLPSTIYPKIIKMFKENSN